MPRKVLELTIEIEIQAVTCPGVWLCQTGRVSLSVFTLGTSYQTCRLPPVFPLLFRDIFYFRKRLPKICALGDLQCMLHGETIYCELVQWSSDCTCSSGRILAQYLGTLNELLFPPHMCSNEGIDLLMRTPDDFPGILSPKIEVATKIRIDEVWDPTPPNDPAVTCAGTDCTCPRACGKSAKRQKPVCHSPNYHKSRCIVDPQTTCCSSFKHFSKPPAHTSKNPKHLAMDMSLLACDRLAGPTYCQRVLSLQHNQSCVDRESSKLLSPTFEMPRPEKCPKLTRIADSVPCFCHICMQYNKQFTDVT